MCVLQGRCRDHTAQICVYLLCGPSLCTKSYQCVQTRFCSVEVAPDRFNQPLREVTCHKEYNKQTFAVTLAATRLFIYGTVDVHQTWVRMLFQLL